MAIVVRSWAPKSGKVGQFPSRFKEISHLPFKPYGLLSKDLFVSPALFTKVALETGYGRTADWTDFISLSNVDRGALGAFLARRLDWILSSFEIADGRVCPSRFSRLIETSEWGSMSYYLGQIGARLGAEVWLDGKVKRALHYSIYTSDAYIKVGAKIESILKADSERTPDLLVEDSNKRWHVFEAKGGGESYRNKAVNSALGQLDAVRAIGPSGFCTAPHSLVCAFTTLRRPDKFHTHPLKIDLVDPTSAESGYELLINPEVSQLRAILLDRLTVRHTSRRPNLARADLVRLNVHRIGSMRTYILMRENPEWEEKAFEVLHMYQSIKKIADRYFETNGRLNISEPLQLATVARELTNRVPLQLPNHRRIIETLQLIAKGDDVLTDRTEFNSAVVRVLQFDELIDVLQEEAKLMQEQVRNTFLADKPEVIESRSGCIFFSEKNSIDI